MLSATTVGIGGFTNRDSVWNFANNGQIPGLIIGDVVYRDGDANGVLD